jgi:hypothetical protein
VGAARDQQQQRAAKPNFPRLRIRLDPVLVIELKKKAPLAKISGAKFLLGGKTPQSLCKFD